MKRKYVIQITFLIIASLFCQNILYSYNDKISPPTLTDSVTSEWHILTLVFTVYDLYGFKEGWVFARKIDATDLIKQKLKQKLRDNGRLMEYVNYIDRISNVFLGEDGLIYISYMANDEELILRLGKTRQEKGDYVVLSESRDTINGYKLQIVTPVLPSSDTLVSSSEKEFPADYEQPPTGYSRRAFLGKLVQAAKVGIVLALTGLPRRLEGSQLPAISVQTFVNWIIRNTNRNTNLPPSFNGDLYWQNAGFIYDHAVAAVVFHLAGEKGRAEAIFDYYKKRFDISLTQLESLVDRNHVYGILRLLPDKDNQLLKGIINAIDINDTSSAGLGREWYLDGGPQYWLAISMLQVNKDKYLKFAESLADFGLRLQDSDGGIRAGPRGQKTNERELDRFELKHTEHNIDAYVLFKMLYAVTGNEKYKKGMDGILSWLKKVYKKRKGFFCQGIDHGGIKDQFATDVQAWSICAFGPETLDRIFGRGTSDKLIENLEKHSLVREAYKKSDGEAVSVIGFDFSDPSRKDIKERRGGYKPVITPEWSSQVALAYYEMAVYSWSKGKHKSAIEYKAKGDAVTANIMSMASGGDGMSFLPYASAAGVPTGFGWNTANAYASIAGTWIIFPMSKYNPFILGGGGLSGGLTNIPSLPLEDANRLLSSKLSANKKDASGSLFNHDESGDTKIVLPAIVPPQEIRGRTNSQMEDMQAILVSS